MAARGKPSKNEWGSGDKLHDFRISVTKVSFEIKTRQLVLRWDLVPRGIINFPIKTWWDNFGGGSDIYYYIGPEPDIKNYPATGDTRELSKLENLR